MQCHLCTSPDPHVRSAHQLHTARAGMDALRTHLYQFFAPQADPDRRQALISDICRWVATIMDTYGHDVDADTGAPMPWWEARRQVIELTAAHDVPF